MLWLFLFIIKHNLGLWTYKFRCHAGPTMAIDGTLTRWPSMKLGWSHLGAIMASFHYLVFYKTFSYFFLSLIFQLCDKTEKIKKIPDTKSNWPLQKQIKLYYFCNNIPQSLVQCLRGLAYFLKQINPKGKIIDPKPSYYFNRIHHGD